MFQSKTTDKIYIFQKLLLADFFKELHYYDSTSESKGLYESIPLPQN